MPLLPATPIQTMYKIVPGKNILVKEESPYNLASHEAVNDKFPQIFLLRARF